MAIDNLMAQLVRDEGMRLKPYQDTVGKLTIGCGRNLTDVGISQAEAELLLDHDITRAETAVAAQLPWTVELDPIRRAVLLNMAFNMGIGRLAKFTRALAAMEHGDWPTAAVEMKKSKWATQVGARADRLAEQIVTGEWQ